VLSVLARAWNLSPSIMTTIKNVFGNAGEKRFDAYTNRATSTRTRAKPPTSIQVRTAVRSGTTVSTVNATLADVLPGGRYAWRAYDYPGTWNTSARPAAMRRLLTALNADAPVIISWLVDFNALDSAGAFRLAQLRTPGRQGGHLTVLHDYQATLPGGRVLAAGQPASAADRERRRRRDARLPPREELLGREPLRPRVAAGLLRPRPAYLHGPIAWVNESRPESPSQQSPLNEMILPPGF
jgi:hypothetical protein